MSKESSYFLVTASGGLCIQPQGNGIYTANVEGEEEQQWIAERGEGGRIAFRNVTGKQYLRAQGGRNGAQVVLGSRQWWKLEGSKTPAGFWIKCEEFPKAYLCNSYGRITPNNLIYMWAPEPYWTQTMLWYVRDVESWKSNNGSSPGLALTSESGGSASAERLQAKETELLQWQQRNEVQEEQNKERQQQLDAQAQSLEVKENALKQREKDMTNWEDRSRKGSKSAPKEADDSHEGQETGRSGLQRHLTDAQVALRESQTRERESIERERMASEAYEKLRQTKAAPAVTTNSVPFETRIDDTVTAHRLRPLFDRTNGDTSGALRDGNISAHGLQPLFERTDPKPITALRDGSSSAHGLQPLFERPMCSHCWMSHAVGEP